MFINRLTLTLDSL